MLNLSKLWTIDLVSFYFHDCDVCNNLVIGIIFLSCCVIVVTIIDITLNPNPSYNSDSYPCRERYIT